ncbi:MAG: UDP-3-O-(3-hydroxymyristoyl)glucosamine N-acyltransferase [Myxococcota bacterium]
MRLGELARALELPYEGDPSLELSGLGGLRDASASDLSFVTGEGYRKQFEASAAGAFLAPPEFETGGRPCLRTSAPYAEFAHAIELFHPRARPAPGVHETAVVGKDVALGEAISIGAYCVIGDGAEIGARSCIHPQATLYPGVRVGEDCVIHSGVHLRDGVVLGKRCVIQSGAVIGGEGFGFVFRADGSRMRVPHRCPVELGDDCEVGANTTIDASHHGHLRRGRVEVRTRLADGVKIDNLVQVGHGASIGERSMLCAQVGLAGSVEVGAGAYLAGQVGVGDNLRVGDFALLGGKAGVTDDIEPGAQVLGYPHMERRRWARVQAALKRLPKLLRRVREIEKKLDIESGD